MRILFVCDYWGTGGIERFIANASIGLSRRGHRCKVFSVVDSGTSLFDASLSKNDISKKSVLFRAQGGASASLYRSGAEALSGLLKEERFDVVHVNAMNSISMIFAQVAEREGVPSRVVHSHNSALAAGKYSPEKAIHLIGRRLLGNFATERIACSYEAGKHLFGNSPFAMVRNGTDTGRFAFDDVSRAYVRRKLGISDSISLIGNVGRLSKAKNPLFHIGITEELTRIMPHGFRYLIAGEGEYAKPLDHGISAKGLDEVVIRLPFAKEPEKLLSALDVFVMPSIFEGLPIAATEAQCAGLPIIASNAISKECAVTDLVRFESLEVGERAWAQEIGESLLLARQKLRGQYAGLVEKTDFSVASMCDKLELIYETGAQR